MHIKLLLTTIFPVIIPNSRLFPAFFPVVPNSRLFPGFPGTISEIFPVFKMHIFLVGNAQFSYHMDDKYHVKMHLQSCEYYVLDIYSLILFLT